MTITATDMINLLHQKHPVDKFVCIPECKVGSTWFQRGCSRFDLWVMARSWAHPRFIGYEIKVARSDFLQDTKWPDYLPYCTEFYFVAPHGIIDPSEVPEQSGLLVGTKNNKLLICKKKAPVRDVEIPETIFVYILMCRTRIVSDTFSRPRAAIWKDRVAEMEANKNIGHTAAYLIRKLSDKRVKEIRQENRKLRDENTNLQMIRECMERMGLTDYRRYSKWNIENKLREALGGIPFDLTNSLRQIERSAGEALKVLEQ